jgi:hypothetical protein
VRFARGFASVALCLPAVLLVAASPAEAASSSWPRFCGQLTAIRAAVEAPPKPDPTHGAAGLAKLRRQYTRLVKLSPTGRIARRLVLVRSLLGHGLTTLRPTPAQRCAVHHLDAAFLGHCDDRSSTGNVFKIVVT